VTRALVLSGGGSVGIAWQSGLIAGLAHRGVELASADLVVGTSAGSAVGAQLALGRDFDEQLARYERAAHSPREDPTSVRSGGSMAERMASFMAILSATAAASPEERRAAIGRFALAADALAEEQFVAVFRYLKGEPWPPRYRCTAVDAESGEFTVWDESKGVELDRAVASSCAVPGLFSPITIGGRRYMDGGMRSSTNADLAAGLDRVLLVSLMSPTRVAPDDVRFARMVETEQAERRALSDAGSAVQVVTPDDGAAAVMGMNLMDGSVAPLAATEGLRQGEALAEEVGSFWM
jgi:NTE family protein